MALLLDRINPIKNLWDVSIIKFYFNGFINDSILHRKGFELNITSSSHMKLLEHKFEGYVKYGLFD